MDLAQQFPTAIQDLEWLISSPPLISESVFLPEGIEIVAVEIANAFTQESCNDIPSLNELSIELYDCIRTTARHYKLGLYCESLLKFALKHDSNFKVLAANLEVKRGLRSFGEFDFIVQENKTVVAHWELAVKYYCLDDSQILSHSIVPDDFIGPEGRDTLQLKLQKLISRQCNLSQTPEGISALSNFQIEVTSPSLAFKRKLFSKGRFFYPYELFLESLNTGLPCKSQLNQNFIHPKSLEGVWCRQENFKEFMNLLCGALGSASKDKPFPYWIVARSRLGWITPPHQKNFNPNPLGAAGGAAGIPHSTHVANSPQELLSIIESASLSVNSGKSESTAVDSKLENPFGSEGIMIDLIPKNLEEKNENKELPRIFLLNNLWPKSDIATH